MWMSLDNIVICDIFSYIKILLSVITKNKHKLKTLHFFLTLNLQVRITRRTVLHRWSWMHNKNTHLLRKHKAVHSDWFGDERLSHMPRYNEIDRIMGKYAIRYVRLVPWPWSTDHRLKRQSKQSSRDIWFELSYFCSFQIENETPIIQYAKFYENFVFYSELFLESRTEVLLWIQILIDYRAMCFP